MTTVLVFGPTGKIGSHAALTAASYGLKVFLGMRDTSKAIPGLNSDDEAHGGYQRVQADLSDAASLESAAQTSGAERAFVYLAHGSKDHMKGAFGALKKGGVKVVVFLSSFTVPTNRELRETPAKEVIPYVHAQAEANLRDVYGEEGYVAMRPGAFVTNVRQYFAGIREGKVVMQCGAFEQDNVDPSDIGRVAGTILAKGATSGQREVYVYGPEIRTFKETALEIGRLLGKTVEVQERSGEDELQRLLDAGVPEILAKYLVEVHSTAGPDKGDGVRFPKYDEGVRNVEEYTGRRSTTLKDWVKENEAELK